ERPADQDDQRADSAAGDTERPPHATAIFDVVASSAHFPAHGSLLSRTALEQFRGPSVRRFCRSSARRPDEPDAGGAAKRAPFVLANPSWPARCRDYSRTGGQIYRAAAVRDGS